MYDSGDSFVVHISKVNRESELLEQLSKKLNFPDCFSPNWNAVYDCLTDFHWIKQQGIVLVHDDLPKLEKQEMKIYLRVLCDATSSWKKGEEHYLKIVFPEQYRLMILGEIGLINQ